MDNRVTLVAVDQQQHFGHSSETILRIFLPQPPEGGKGGRGGS